MRPIVQPKRAIELVLFFVLGILALNPFRPSPVSPGLDPSWVLGLADAIAKHRTWGTNYIFTYGPFGDLVTRVCAPGYCTRMFAITIFLAGLYTVVLWRLLRRADFTIKAFAIVGLFCLAPHYGDDVILAHTCFVLAFDEVTQPSRRLCALKCIAFAFIALSKLSVLPLAVLLLCVIDGVSLSERRIPIGIAAFSVSCLVIWLLIGQPIAGVIPTLRTTIDTISGYGDAMSFKGPWREERTYLYTLGIWLVFFAWNARHLSKPRAAGVVAVFLFTHFMAFKAGFTRGGGGHTRIAWLTLDMVVLTGALWIASTKQALAGRVPALTVAAATIYFGIVPPSLASYRDPNNPVINVEHKVNEGMRDAAAFFSGPLAVIRNHEHLYETELTAAPPIAPLTDAKTVDSTHWQDTPALIASGVYAPRPIDFEYQAYTPTLLAANAAYLASENAPDEFRFGFFVIDSRLPALMESSSWPVLLSAYAPHSVQNGELILRRRASSEPVEKALLTTQSVEINQWFTVADDESTTWAEIDLTPTVWGKLRGAVFKRGLVGMDCQRANGETFTNRIIPGIVRAGFVISPEVREAEHMRSLWYPRELRAGFTRPRVVKKCRVTASEVAARDWRSPMTVKTYSLDNSNSAITPSQPERDHLARIAYLQSLAESSPAGSQLVQVSSEGLFIHGGNYVDVPVGSKRQATLVYGIREGAWSASGSTDGAAFVMRDAEHVDAQPFWTGTISSDPNAQHHQVSATVLIPVGVSKMRLESTCVSSCNMDWTYVTDLRFDDAPTPVKAQLRRVAH